LCCLLLMVSAPAQAQIEEALERLQTLSNFKGSTLGLMIRDEKGKEMYSLGPDTYLIPASNTKLYTSAAAWQLLGPDFRFSTILEVYGTVRDSVLTGMLRVRASGDPLLGLQSNTTGKEGSQVLEGWYRRLMAHAGIHTIRGGVVIEPERFPGPTAPVSWEWGDLGTCFAPGQWPLNWEANCKRITLWQDSLGWYFERDSLVLPWQVIYQPDSSARPELTYVALAPDGYTYWLGGPPEPPLPLAMRVAMPNPPFYFRERLMDFFEKRGIQWDGYPAGGDSTPLLFADTIWSLPLSVLCVEVNANSNNLVAESLLRKMGQHLYSDASINGGLRALNEWIRRNLPTRPGPHLRDGSGMSRHNALTSRQVTELLHHIKEDSLMYAPFRETLALAGEQGTLQWRLADKMLKGKIWAKTGSLDRVRTLSGYIETRSGKVFTFSLLVNHYRGTTVDFYREITPLLKAMRQVGG
jgi:D-alanyl-D-alanine carboxypeptidase/D-alanyl-D-alanine-endopeptidase (penicillin-binding protein 4)